MTKSSERTFHKKAASRRIHADGRFSVYTVQALVRSLVCLIALAGIPFAFGKDSLIASAYAPLVSDLLQAFHAEETLCTLATYQHDVCFVASPAGAGHLAEVLSAVAAGYSSADLRLGPWRSANGVWAVELTFGRGAYGSVELFLVEGEPGAVRGMFIFYEPR